ncbi:hypothetical protein ACFXKJ_37945 [Kitasatospora indigofera]|uniref:hypothetical protein n=1 Tax=Kitasatospora indigofera TaxID=67307 RepID=UPI0036AA27ED
MLIIAVKPPMSTNVTPKLAISVTVPVTICPRCRVLRKAQSWSLGVGSVRHRDRTTPSLSGRAAVNSGWRASTSSGRTAAARAAGTWAATAVNWVSSAIALVIRPSWSSQTISTMPSLGSEATSVVTSVDRSGQTVSRARGASWERTASMLWPVRRCQREAFWTWCSSRIAARRALTAQRRRAQKSASAGRCKPVPSCAMS